MLSEENKEKIIFIGMFNAFKIEGAKVYRAESSEEAEKILEELKNQDCIIILAERFWKSERIKNIRKTSRAKILLMHDAREKTGKAREALKELIARATGIVLKE